MMAGPKGYTKQVFALYRGDEYVMDGTINEIAAKRHVKKETLLWMLSPTYQRRLARKRKDGKPRNMIALVMLDDEEEDE